MLENGTDMSSFLSVRFFMPVERDRLQLGQSSSSSQEKGEEEKKKRIGSWRFQNDRRAHRIHTGMVGG